MARYITNLIDDYHHIIDHKGDPRVSNWPMMSGPIPTVAIVICYVIFVTKIGPQIMKDRKPFQMNKVLIVYNVIHVFISIWLFYEISVSGWLTFYSFGCQPIDYSNEPSAVRMAQAAWWYYISKFLELLDTIFFVMRKKFDHISTLHLIHHSIMPMSCWIGVKFFAGGQGTFFGFLNTFVHIIMYTYYMLAALGPKVQPYLWWKKYLTLLQIVQFILVAVHSILNINCDSPDALVYVIVGHAILFLGLFSNFYVKSYLAKNDKKIRVPISKETDEQNNIKMKHNGYSISTTGDNLRQRGVS